MNLANLSNKNTKMCNFQAEIPKMCNFLQNKTSAKITSVSRFTFLSRFYPMSCQRKGSTREFRVYLYKTQTLYRKLELFKMTSTHMT